MVAGGLLRQQCLFVLRMVVVFDVTAVSWQGTPVVVVYATEGVPDALNLLVTVHHNQVTSLVGSTVVESNVIIRDALVSLTNLLTLV